MLFKELQEVNDMEGLLKRMDKVFQGNEYVKPASIFKNRNFKLTTRVGQIVDTLNMQ